MWLAALWHDSRHAWRRFSGDRGFVAAAVLTYALGIGGTTAVWAIVYGVLLRPLPVAGERSVVVAYRTDTLGNTSPISYPRLEAWQASGVFAGVAGTSELPIDLVGTPGTERTPAAAVSNNFFDVLGVRAAHGRVFSATDAGMDWIPAVISDGLWRRRFAGDPAVVGTDRATSRGRVVVVGIMPPGFERWRGHTDVWMPIDRVVDPAVLQETGYLIVTPIGRLAPGTTRSGTSARLEAVPNPEDEAAADTGIRLVGLRDDVVSPRVERLVMLAFATMALAWLVVCANLSMLLLARDVRRSRELAVRLALGATRRRVCVQILVENAWLALAGGTLGAAVAVWAMRLLVVSAPPALLEAYAVRMDRPVLLLALALTALTALISGMAPALRASRPGTSLVSRDRSRRHDTRLSHALIVGQIAVALMMLTGASLLVRSLMHMQQVALGFDDTHVVTASVALPAARYDTASPEGGARVVQAQRTLVERLASIPGVDEVTAGDPVFSPGRDNRVSIAFDDGRRLLNGNPEQRPLAPVSRYVGPGYMRVHGIGLVAGRELRPEDDLQAPYGVLINETMAGLHWPGQDPIGRRVHFGRRQRDGTFDEPWATVIGVVADVRHNGIDRPVAPEIYRAQFQHPRSQVTIAFRTTVLPATVMPAVRETVSVFDPEIPVLGMRALTDSVAETRAAVRYGSAWLSGLAALAVVLCGVGLFSLLAGSVAARRHEIAIRLALGAQPRRMLVSVAGRASAILAAGLLIGGVASAAGAHALSSLLYDVAPLDPASHAIGVLALAVTGFAAAWTPARRAASIDPVRVLSQE